MQKLVFLVVVIAAICVLVKALNPKNHLVAGDPMSMMSPVSPQLDQR
jgi:hypothetical protein